MSHEPRRLALSVLIPHRPHPPGPNPPSPNLPTNKPPSRLTQDANSRYTNSAISYKGIPIHEGYRSQAISLLKTFRFQSVGVLRPNHNKPFPLSSILRVLPRTFATLVALVLQYPVQANYDNVVLVGHADGQG